MKTVALLDHHSEGHHGAFINLFAKYLIKAGYNVVVFFPVREMVSDYNKEPASFKFFHFAMDQNAYSGFGKFNHTATILKNWINTRKAIKKAEKKLGVKFDFVFFAWLDDYLANYLPHVLIDLIFPYKWSGLYFHPWYLFDKDLSDRVSTSSIDSVLRAKNCMSVGIHDEFLIEKLARRIHKEVVFFPEIANTKEPLKTFDIALQIKEKAEGRISVGLIGLAKRKGTLHFIELAKHADQDLFFFFLAGKITESDYTPSEFRVLNNFLLNLPDNCFYFPDSIPEGEKINAVIDSLDILFLIYDNFKSSSNFNTKAAHFKKPVLASNRFWIGNVTEKFLMGVTVEEGNLQQALAGLDEIRAKLRSGTFDFSKYDDYLSIHKEDNLIHSFNKAFGYDK